MQHVFDWIAESPYSAALGIEAVSVTPEAARLRLPYDDKNSNPGKALHGGCAGKVGNAHDRAGARQSTPAIGQNVDPGVKARSKRCIRGQDLLQYTALIWKPR